MPCDNNNACGRSSFPQGECCDTNAKNPWKDPAFWWMLIAIVATLIMTSISAMPSKLGAYDKAFEAEAAEYHIPFLRYKWVAPLFYLGVFASYFLCTYLVYRKIDTKCDWSESRKNTTKSMMALIYIVNLVLVVLATWALLGSGSPAIALLFVLGLIGANVWQLIYMTRITHVGAYWLIIPFIVMNVLVTLPFTVSGIMSKHGKGGGMMSKKPPRGLNNPIDSIINDIEKLAP